MGDFLKQHNIYDQKKSKNLLWSIMTFLSLTSLSHNSFALDSQFFSMPTSISLGIGRLESKDLDFNSRTMSALSFELLPSYRFNSWQFGPHLDYRIQGQVTSTSDTNGTNLKGTSWLLGIGARYEFTHRLFAQGSFDFIGDYNFSNNTVENQKNRVHKPLGIRFKTGYAYFEKWPLLTFDADIQYLNFTQNTNGTNTVDALTSQWILSIGISYQFGSDSNERKQEIEWISPVTVPAEKKTPQKIDGAEVVGDSLRISLAGISFEANSAKLSESAKAAFATSARVIAESQGSIRIEGHSDSTGNRRKNKALSYSRAEAVKAVLIEMGTAAERISTIGLGDTKPIHSNATKEGREKNRRVEIYIDAK